MEPFFFRSWVEQYTIKNDGKVKVESPNGGVDGFTQIGAGGGDLQIVLRPQNVQPLFQITVRTGMPGGRHV